MAQPVKHWAYIDALRGLAAFGVIVAHTGVLVRQVPWRASEFFTLGAHGVQLFFMVSAVTLASSWHARAAQEANPKRAFFIRRFFRIAPLFWAALLAYLLVDLTMTPFWKTGPVEPQSVFLTLIFANGWTPASINGVVPGGWSITAEMAFYLMFPALIAIVTNLPRALIFFGLSVVTAMAANQYAGTLYGAAAKPSFVYYWLPTQLPIFAMGLMVYHLIPWARGAGPALSRWLLAAGVLLLAVVAFGGLPWQSDLSRPAVWRDLVAGAGFLAIILALAARPWPLFVNEATRQMGEVSFSVYLLQFAVIQVALSLIGRSAIGGWRAILLYIVVAVAISVVTMLLATITYRRIEKPFIRLGHRLASGAETRPAHSAT